MLSYSIRRSIRQYKPHGKGTGLYYFYNSSLGKYQYSNIVYTPNDLAPFTSTLAPNGVTGYWDVYRGIQIHETGNALAELTGKYSGEDPDSYWTNPVTGMTYSFSNQAQSTLVREKGLKPGINLDIGNHDTDSGQTFELNVMKKYRQLTGYTP